MTLLRNSFPILCAVSLLLLTIVWASGACVARTTEAEQDGIQNPDASSEWPKFRHDLANSGTTDSPVPPYAHLVWKKNLGGSLSSSASVVNNIIYVGSWETSGVPGKVHALNLTTNSPIWTYIAGANGVPSSPAVDGGRVFFGTRNNNIVALDAISGAEKWNISTGGAVYASPAVSGGTVVVPCLDGKVYARDQISGSKVWESGLFSSSESSPAIANGKVYLGDEAGYVYALYLSNGSSAWTFDTKGGFIPTAPAVYNGIVYISNSKQMKIYALDANNGVKKWEKNISSTPTPQGIKSSAAVHNGNIILGTRDGHMWALNATSGSVVWNKPGYGVIKSSPTVSDGKVIFGSEDGFLYVLDETSGDLSWKYNITAVMESSATVYNGNILIGGKDNYLYILGFDVGPPMVTGNNPKDGAKAVPVTEEVWVQFSEEMKTDSLIGAITVTPAFDFNLTWDASNIKVTLSRNTTLKANANYTVNVLGNITDMQGNAMGSAFSFGFSTQDVIAPKVISTKPVDKEENVSATTTISIRFSKKMHHNATESAFGISPSVSGSFKWDSSDMNMSFTPLNALNGDTWYAVTESENAQDIIGNKMGVQYKFSFHTFDNVGPRVTSTSPKDAETGVKSSAAISITFSEIPDETSAKNGFGISPGISISSSTLTGKVLVVKPTGLLGDTKYTVTISNVKDLKGNPGPGFSFWFKTTDATAPYIKSSNPSSGGTGVKVGTTISILFSEEMDKVSVENAMTLSPSLSFMTKWDNASPTVTMTPGAILSECTKYYLNISTGAKDISGNQLVQSFSLSFTTDGQCKTPPPPPPENPIIDFFFKYWWVFLMIFIIIMIAAIAIPGRKTLAMYYGVDENDQKR